MYQFRENNIYTNPTTPNIIVIAYLLIYLTGLVKTENLSVPNNFISLKINRETIAATKMPKIRL